MASPLLRQSDLESPETKNFMSLFKRTHRKKCRQHLCLDLYLDIFFCRRSSDWIKENVTGNRERSISVCTRVRGRHFFQLSLENPISRRVTFILAVNSHFGKHAGTETLGVQFGSFPSKIFYYRFIYLICFRENTFYL